MGAAKSSPRATIQAPRPMPEEDACQTGMEELGGCHGMDRGLMGISLSWWKSTYHHHPGRHVGPTSVVLHKPKKKKGLVQKPCKVWYHKTMALEGKKRERHRVRQGDADKAKTRNNTAENRQPREQGFGMASLYKTGGNQQLK